MNHKQVFNGVLETLLTIFLITGCSMSPTLSLPPTTPPTIVPAISTPTMSEAVSEQALVPTQGRFTTLQPGQVITRENEFKLTQLDRPELLELVDMRAGRLEFSPTADILAIGIDNNIKLVNIGTGTLLAELNSTIPAISNFVFSSDGKLIAAGGGRNPQEGGRVQIWEVASQAVLLNLDNFNYSVSDLDFSPDGTILATGETGIWDSEGSVKLWDVTTGKLLDEFGLKHEVGTPTWWSVDGVDFNSDGTLLAAMMGNGKVLLWDVVNKQEKTIIDAATGMGWDATFSPDGKLLATSGSTDSANYIADFRLWNLETGELLFNLGGYEALGNSIAFSPNGQVLASCSYDGVVANLRLLDVMTGEILTTLDVPFAAYFAFNADGSILATSGYEDTVRLWSVPAP